MLIFETVNSGWITGILPKSELTVSDPYQFLETTREQAGSPGSLEGECTVQGPYGYLDFATMETDLQKTATLIMIN